jgi:hypothetical protein
MVTPIMVLPSALSVTVPLNVPLPGTSGPVAKTLMYAKSANRELMNILNFMNDYQMG